ncbi:MAG: head-tail connector protein [Magnetococcus sp. WYHC-3]
MGGTGTGTPASAGITGSGRLVSAPSTEALRLGDIKRHLRLSTGATNEDKMLKVYRAAARDRVETYLERKLIHQRWYHVLDEWPEGEYFRLQYAPVTSAPSSAIVYKKSDGTSTTLSSSAWEVDIMNDPGRISLGYGEDWPTDSLWNVNPIRVEYKVGYSNQSTGIPEAITNAMLLIIGHLYENREEVSVVGAGRSVQQIPKAAEYLLAPYRNF